MKEAKESWFNKAITKIRDIVGIRDLPERDPNGFKEVTRKSLYFKSSRYSETLMEIAMMCKENSLHDFVGNL